MDLSKTNRSAPQLKCSSRQNTQTSQDFPLHIWIDMFSVYCFLTSRQESVRMVPTKVIRILLNTKYADSFIFISLIPPRYILLKVHLDATDGCGQYLSIVRCWRVRKKLEETMSQYFRIIKE
jgi:hypothetical protein